MNKKKLNTIYDYLIALQDRIEQGEQTSSETAYQEMGKLILSGVKTDYRGNILVSEKDWQKLKQAGTELDEIVEWNPEYKKVSNRLWKVINHVEGIEGY